MLWYKSWLETRVRAAVALFFMGVFLFGEYRSVLAAPRSLFDVEQSAWLVVPMICIMLSGAGIVTQPAFQATKGLHGSTLFTLSLPVTRFRLLAIPPDSDGQRWSAC